ncbi:MAG: hypothetical protein DI585_03360 [Pseudomonas fluorescens]|nr:MAG: hypothetical protein DI585_03360 [Pseudomonas fluorescens]
MLVTMNWVSAATFRRPSKPMLALMSLAGMGGTALLFLHLMQTSAPFAETVALVSPDLATALSCKCPWCSPACSPPADQIGIQRFDNLNLTF